MQNNETILKRGAKALKLLKQLQKESEACLKSDSIEVDFVQKRLNELIAIFEPYDTQLRELQEKRKQHELELKQICAKKGHIGEWKEEHYTVRDWMGDISDRQLVDIPCVKWTRICTRCGQEEISKTEPKEVTKLKKKAEIKELKKKIKKIEAEL